MGIHLNPELLAYVHAEKLETTGDWSINLGGAQQSMFTNLLTGMFDQLEFIADPLVPIASELTLPAVVPFFTSHTEAS